MKSSRTTKKKQTNKNPLSCKRDKESSDDTTDDEWILEHPRSEVISQEDGERWTPVRKGKRKKNQQDWLQLLQWEMIFTNFGVELS